MLKTLRSSLLTFGSAGILLLLLFLAVNRVHAAPPILAPGIIQGRVTDVDHQPLANIIIGVMPDPLAAGARTRTLADGSYRLAVPPGTYRVFMTGAELYSTPQVYVTKYYPNAATEKTAQPITVTSDAVIDHIDVQLDRYGVIEGTVSDEHGQPLSQLQVKVYRQESDTSAVFIPYYPPSEVTTDAQGHYHVPDLYAGVYKLFFADPHIPAQVQGEFLGHTTVLTTAQEINVHLNQLVANVNISLTHKTDVAPFRLRQLVTTPLFPNFLLAVNTAEQLIYSRDGGHKWLHATTPVTPVLPAIAPRTSVTSPIRLLFAANDSIYRTGDWGVSWAKQLITPHPECDTPTTIIALASQPTQPTHVFGYAICWFGTWESGGHFRIEFHSEDGGINWVQNLTDHFPPLGVSPGESVVAVDGNHPTTHYQVTYATNTQIGGTQTFFQISTDAGQTWGAGQWMSFCGFYEDLVEPVDNLHLYWLPVQNGVLVLVCKKGLFHSVDQGKTWTRAPLEFGHGDFGFAKDYGHPSRLLSERDTGLWASDDLGETWTQFTQHYEANQLYLPRVIRP